jgi:hypothetical protein
MLQKAEEYAQERRRRIAEQKAIEKARKEELAALARENYLNELAKRESETWKKVESLRRMGK